MAVVLLNVSALFEGFFGRCLAIFCPQFLMGFLTGSFKGFFVSVLDV